jgi:hypothetical protein
LHFAGNAAWSDAAVLGKVRELTLPAMERHGSIEAWILDDTGYPKKGKHSAGVARQYCGQLGKQDVLGSSRRAKPGAPLAAPPLNCQNAVSISIANHHGSLPIGYRMSFAQGMGR